MPGKELPMMMGEEKRGKKKKKEEWKGVDVFMICVDVRMRSILWPNEKSFKGIICAQAEIFLGSKKKTVENRWLFIRINSWPSSSSTNPIVHTKKLLVITRNSQLEGTKDICI